MFQLQALLALGALRAGAAQVGMLCATEPAPRLPLEVGAAPHSQHSLAGVKTAIRRRQSCVHGGIVLWRSV